MSEFERNFVNMFDLLICLTKACDLISHELENHHQQVAYLALRIAEQLGLPVEQKKDLILAGLLHDIGTVSLDERLELIENEPLTAQNHALRGAKLIEGFSPLQNAADIIRFHHVPWNHGEGNNFQGNRVPDLSHILHLADRVAVLAGKKQDVLGKVMQIRQVIQSQKGRVFHPDYVDAFLKISAHEYIWLDLVYSPLISILPKAVAFDTLELSLDEVISLTEIFSNIIDSRSPFTAYHSAGVAGTAEKLAELAGFSEVECKMMRIAGNLHDLGKLAVRREVLEKQGRLSVEEFNEIRSHTFHTYRLLELIKGFETINQWASFHHEKLNGKGYPFHLKAASIPFGSRIMAVADIFTAISENRPYRKGMEQQEVVSVLQSMVRDGSICPQAVSLLLSNHDLIEETRRMSQQKARYSFPDSMDETRKKTAILQIGEDSSVNFLQGKEELTV